jgi:hypothetical protein
MAQSISILFAISARIHRVVAVEPGLQRYATFNNPEDIRCFPARHAHPVLVMWVVGAHAKRGTAASAHDAYLHGIDPTGDNRVLLLPRAAECLRRPRCRRRCRRPGSGRPSTAQHRRRGDHHGGSPDSTAKLVQNRETLPMPCSPGLRRLPVSAGKGLLAHRVRLGGQELPPGRPGPPGRWIDARGVQDLPHR